MSTQKTKGLVVGKMVCDGDMDSVIVEGGGGIKMVDCFTYLGSNLACKAWRSDIRYQV